MTEKELWKTFDDLLYYGFEEKDQAAMKGFVKGENELPKNLKAKNLLGSSEIIKEIDGPNDALAFKMFQAMASVSKPSDVLTEKGGVRVLHSFGFTLPQIFDAEAGNRGQYSEGREAFKYYQEEAEPFIDEYLKTPKSKNDKSALYGFVIAMMMEFLKLDSVKYKKYIEPLEEFVTRVCEDTFNDIEWEDWVTQREHRRAAWGSCGMGFGALSPALKKLERRILLGNRKLVELGLSKEELLAWGKVLVLPEEWAEVIVLTNNNYPTSDGLPKYEHFKKLFKENRPLFDKTYRSFYWKYDGKTSDDDVIRTPACGIHDGAFLLLAIMLDSGDGAAQKEELVKNWKAITADIPAYVEENLHKQLDFNAVIGPLMLYKYDLPPIDALFAKLLLIAETTKLSGVYCRTYAVIWNITRNKSPSCVPVRNTTGFSAL